MFREYYLEFFVRSYFFWLVFFLLESRVEDFEGLVGGFGEVFIYLLGDLIIYD